MIDENEFGSVNILAPCNYLPINKKINKPRHSQVTSCSWEAQLQNKEPNP
jgi:hypothetical protein